VALTAPAVASALAAVQARISRAGGDLERVKVVAVTKGFGPDAAGAAIAAGVNDLGESYADELLRTREQLGPMAGECRWHFIGRVQRNKVGRLAGIVHLWHGVDRIAAAEEITRRAPGASVLVQVNISGEPGKNGCTEAEAPALVSEIRRLDLDARGLMAIGLAGSPESARSGFRRLSRLADTLALPERSMGMSDDLEIAVEEGSTMVRVGRALFGPRFTRPELGR